MSLSEGGGEPSTQPFQPFFAAARFLRGRGAGGSDSDLGSRISPSSGVLGLLEDVRDVLEDIEGPGVEPGVEGRWSVEVVGEGVTETERCCAGI